MAHVKGGNVARKRRRKVLKLAKGYYGSKRTLYKTAHEQVMKSLTYAYRDRKQRKRNFRKLWITRINAATRMNGMSYSRFMNGLKRAGVEVNRKMLADIAVNDMESFANLVKIAEEGLSKEVVTKAKPEPKKETKKEAPKKEAKVEEKKETPKKEEKVEEPKAEVKEEKTETVDYDSMTVADLKALAKDRGLSGYSKLKKAELIDLLK